MQQSGERKLRANHGMASPVVLHPRFWPRTSTRSPRSCQFRSVSMLRCHGMLVTLELDFALQMIEQKEILARYSPRSDEKCVRTIGRISHRTSLLVIVVSTSSYSL